MFDVKHLSKTFYQGNTETVLFKDVSYRFDSGCSYAIMGPSGSGKSTLLHMLLGIDQPTSGTVLWGDINVTQALSSEKEQMRSHFGIVFQKPYLVAELTVLENVMLQAFLKGSCSKKDRERGLELLASIGLQDKVNGKPALLSGGEQQKVALLRALFNKPSWLLIDEPTGSLDIDSKKSVLLLLKQYRSLYNMGIIMSTHDEAVAKHMDEIILIKDKSLETKK